MPVGVLALQGSVREHLDLLERSGGKGIPVKTLRELEQVQGLILPGGESTAMGKLLQDGGLMAPLAERIRRGMPVWGTCAGMVLLASGIEGEETVHLGVMDMTVRRNAYGTQRESFSVRDRIPEMGLGEVPLVFIRAPHIVHAARSVRILKTVRGAAVAARQKNMLATSFHPELTAETGFHRYFLDMVEEAGGSRMFTAP
ncbi:pyridoxal 5'-phosphate synthase glutaminase subunit PdxT [Anaerotalea alkaliphila]|uniref:Pyridoxal 5'-phosphate synthase subunit PdxT n=1 Tax=Anaerotalea alkaliphila TaxID=2662126 RepID=A0A7X5HX95_9FIRM|nr:pyridoxal 5'-phosphate synthase glutaminase subunit PdxT [Anaerotalea alkaliphila]NDL68317.1 pyridoxal 5'-phosphate synthase glutaminase subunit PdxT [Anaerotalea alkaliphila]